MNNDLSQIKGVAFDLDGTLVESLSGLTSALSSALQACGYAPVGADLVEKWIGNGVDMLILRALMNQGETKILSLQQKVREKYNIYYKQQFKDGTSLYPGVADTLLALQDLGLKLAVVTNKPTLFVNPILSELGIDIYFDLILGGDDVSCKKPHPAPIYLALSQLGLHAHELLFVGDSRNDVQAAKSAHCPVVGVTYGYNYGEPISLSKPDYLVDNFVDILQLIKIVS